MNILIYNEYVHERSNKDAMRVYPEGMHKAIADGLLHLDPSFNISYAFLENHTEVITKEKLAETDVMIWWGHMKHHLVADEVVDLIWEAVNKGMGLIVLHSGHESKIFRKLMGTRCSVHWRVDDENGRIWILNENHPIAEGVHNPIELTAEETYCEPFDVPVPDELIGITWWKGGEVFRGMSVYNRGQGKIFYFHPGHETFPSYYNQDVLRVIFNAVHYVAPVRRIPVLTSVYRLPAEEDILFERYEKPDEYPTPIAPGPLSFDDLGPEKIHFKGTDSIHGR